MEREIFAAFLGLFFKDKKLLQIVFAFFFIWYYKSSVSNLRNVVNIFMSAGW